jgi:hypothetical protein
VPSNEAQNRSLTASYWRRGHTQAAVVGAVELVLHNGLKGLHVSLFHGAVLGREVRRIRERLVDL